MLSTSLSWDGPGGDRGARTYAAQHLREQLQAVEVGLAVLGDVPRGRRACGTLSVIAARLSLASAATSTFG